MNKNLYFKLPEIFDAQRLLADLEVCLASAWKPHFNTRDYQGEWTSLALRSPSGNASDIATYTTDGHYRDTPLMAQCLCFKEVVAHFECEKETVRLLRLSPNSVVKEHTDFQLGYEYGIFRLHIPLTTSSEVHFCVGGVDLPMRAGECWYANFHHPHSVVNASDQARIHLVMDCIRNEWSDALFAQIGFDFEAARRTTEPDAATVQKMLTLLREMNTPAAAALIAHYQAHGQPEPPP